MMEKVYMYIAWRLPKRLVYWCAIRMIAYGTQGEYGDTDVPDFKAMEALERWRM